MYYIILCVLSPNPRNVRILGSINVYLVKNLWCVVESIFLSRRVGQTFGRIISFVRVVPVENWNVNTHLHM